MSINKLITGKGLSEHQSQNIPKKAYPKSQLDSSDLIKHYTEESFFVVDADLKIITFSEKFQEKYTRYLGRDIIKGQNILSYAPTMRLEIAKNIYKQVLQGQTLEVEVALPGPDNTIYSTINKYKPIYDNQKHIIGVFVACSDITPTRKAQNETQKSEENYRAIVENSVNAFFFSDHDGSVIDVNDAAVKMFGYSVVEIKRLNRNDLIDHTDSKFVKDLEEQEKTGSMKGEAIGIRKNGENFAVEISSTFYKDFNNEIKAGTFINDISARKKAERRVELNEKRFRSLVENSTDMLILSDKDDVIEYVSPAFEKLTGYEPSEVIGKRNLDFLHPEQAEEIKEITQKLLENPGISIPRQNRIKHKGGHFIWIEGCVKNLLLDENVHAIVSNYYDITERLKAAEELRRSENSLKTIFENTTEAFLLIDGHGKVKAFNSNARIFAFLNTPNEIEIGQDALNFIADDRKEVVMALFEKAFAGEIIQFDRLYEKEDSKTWIDFSIRPVVEDDIITGVCVTGVDITGRKKAEEELRKRELRFRSILENSHDMLFLFDADGKVEFLSPAIEKAFGYTNGEEEIHHILDSIHPEDLQYTIEQLRHVFESPEVPVSMTFRKKKRAGSYIWLEGTLTNLLHIPDINVVVANFTDITERKHFEENQALYVSIVNLSEDAIFSQSLENKIITWNKGASKLFGFSADEVLGNDCHLIIPQNRLCEEDEIFEKIKQGISVENFETQGRKKNGELIYISLTVSPIRDSKGNIKGASKIARDISDKKRAEDAISNNEKRFRSLLQNSNDGLSLMSIDGVMLEISPAGKKITGFDEHEMIGQARYDLIHPDDLQDVSQAFIDVIEDPEKTRNFEYRSLSKDGTYKWLEASCTNLLQEPAVGAIVINYRDITERKNHEIEREQLIKTLHQNNNDLRNFSYITSHNLTAPLSNLMGFIDLLQDIKIKDATLRTIIEGFKTSTIQLNTTVNDLIKILIIRDSDSIEQKEILFGQIFAQIKGQLGNLLEEVEPEIEFDFTGAPSVVFNETYLESIFMNLLTNAIKYRSYERNLKIKIESHKEADTVILTFRDNGIGIDLDRHKSKIFGLYQRFHDRPNSKGLGLYLIKSQMESLEGSINVESVVDTGTTFTLRFAPNP